MAVEKKPKRPRGRPFQTGRIEELNPRQARFVAEYAKHGNATLAAKSAGYSPSNAQNRANSLMRESPAVKTAVAEIRNSLIETGKYNLACAMDEAQKTIDFAERTGNANAMAKAVELRAKLNGLLVEKHDHRVANFQLNIGGIDDPIIPTTSKPVSEDEEEDFFS